MECYLTKYVIASSMNTNKGKMNRKILATIMGVFLCVLLFSFVIGIVGGILGLIGSVIGGIFGLAGGFLGAVFGFIEGIFEGVFGLVGWIFDGIFSWHGPFVFFHWNVFTITVLVFVILLLTRSKISRSGK